MSMNILNDISAVYKEQVAESAVPGKPAERLGAVTAIPKSEQEAAAERIRAKTAAKRAKMKEETEIEEASYSAKAARAGKDIGKPGKAFAKIAKSAAERYGSEERGKKVAGAVLAKLRKEALDPVGQEDADIDNDGDTDKSDKYLHKRRKAIGNAIAKKKGVKESSDYDPMDDDDFDHDEAEENRGVSGKNNPKGGKALGKKKKSVKEGFSNWRQDLSEVMDDVEASKEIKEKKVNNKIKINPEMKEAVEQLGGELLEMVEVDEAVYGANKAKKEQPKDTRYTVTSADKTANTKAYQLYKSGDKRYKAADHLGEENLDEKALSKQQQKFMGMVYAVKKGDMKAPSPEVAKAASGMTKKQAKDFAKTKHKGLPQVKEDVLNEREHDEPGEGTRQKYGDMRGIDRSGPATSFGGKWQSKERKAAGAAALAKNKKVQEQMDEPMEPAVDKQAEMQKKKIQMQKVRELTTRLQSARRGVY